MINTNLAHEYIDNIPWNKHPVFAFSGDADDYIQAFKNQIKELPVGDMKISFDDDIWDFNPYLRDVTNIGNRIRFDCIPKEIREYAKFFVLYRIMGKAKISTTKVRVTSAASIINNIIKKTNHKSIFVITTNDIIEEVKQRNVSSSTAHNLYEGIFQFYYFLKNNYRFDLPVDIEELKKRGITEKNKSKKVQEETKIPDLPDEFFNAILSAAIRIMKDESVSYNRRATACLLIIITQTGFRVVDSLALKVEQLHEKTLARIDKRTHYIHYATRKPSKTDNNLLEFDVFSNTLCTEAYKTLITIRKTVEEAEHEEYIYILKNQHGNIRPSYPVNVSRFRAEYRKFLYEELPDYSLREWDGVNRRRYKSKKEIDVTLSVPDTRQYRVHLCTQLYEKGVPLTYIQKYMGHLTEYMMGYYVRPKDRYQENIAYSEKVIREIAKDDVNLLGHKNGSEIKANIQQFIRDNHFNVETDMDAIIEAFGERVVIRGKTGGVCIKTSLLPCSKDVRTNELMCAYDICPNLFHMYYMVDVTYMNYLTLVETYEKALDRGQKRESQKELNKLQDVIRRKLLVELNELDSEICKNGEDQILERYPGLREIIENRESIRKEALEWLS